MTKEKLLEVIREMIAKNWKDSDLDAKTEKILAFIAENDYKGRDEDLEAFVGRINSARTETPALFVVQDALKHEGWNFEKAILKNLQELTGQESGIVIYDGKDGILCNWSSINGFPRISATGLIGLGEEIPEVEGEHYDDLSGLLEGVNIEIYAYYTDDELPKSGTVYQIGDITVIAPDGWV